MLSADEKAVLESLQDYERRINEILDLLGERSSIPIEDESRLKDLLTSLKSDMKAAGRRGKVNDDGLPQTEAEASYFAGTLAGALTHFSIRTNSHPISANWSGCLFDVRVDFTHSISQLLGMQRYR